MSIGGSIGLGVMGLLGLACGVFWLLLKLEKRKSARQLDDIKKLRGELISISDMMRRFASGEEMDF
ncbi:MAG: hypothetical protein KDM63_06560, partial [Verrucomicrobiae bacterium]|nr:hypothetical protein [Verrucomicrobiae bacterium]